MKIIVPYTLKLPGEGWNIKTNRYYITFSICFNMRTGIIDVFERMIDQIIDNKGRSR